MPSEEKRRALGQVCAKLVSSKWSVGSGEERLRSGDVGGLRLEAARGQVEVKVEGKSVGGLRLESGCSAKESWRVEV